VLGAANSAGGTLTFEIVDGPSLGTVVIDDVVDGDFTYTPDDGESGSDSFTFRVSEDGAWSAPATVTVSIGAPVVESSLRGRWAFDEGSGSVGVDDSDFGNDGTFVGSPSWVSRDGGSALLLDGDSDYVEVGHDDSLDVSDELTLAIWIRPEVRRTQYVFIKTDGEDGFELSLSSSGRMFVRFNKETSGNDYRVDSDSTYPTNGTDWVHLAATYDGDTIRLYVDGELEASADGPSSVGTNNDPLGIGAGAE
jgi:hypothetical protein